jgi:hypothetical protein
VWPCTCVIKDRGFFSEIAPVRVNMVTFVCAANCISSVLSTPLLFRLFCSSPPHPHHICNSYCLFVMSSAPLLAKCQVSTRQRLCLMCHIHNVLCPVEICRLTGPLLAGMAVPFNYSHKCFHLQHFQMFPYSAGQPIVYSRIVINCFILSGEDKLLDFSD